MRFVVSPPSPRLKLTFLQSSDDTETERQKEEQRKADEEKSKEKSGTSSKGTSTPSDRPKHIDALKKARKRPGSPNLSDASGTDTSRKKPKKAAAQALTSQPASRPMSPAPGTKKPTKKRARNGAGSGSDVDRAGSGGEMSDAASALPKKLKLNVKKGTPSGSRAGSPTRVPPGGSRASSPEGPGGARGKSFPAILFSRVSATNHFTNSSRLSPRHSARFSSSTTLEPPLPIRSRDPRRYPTDGHRIQRTDQVVPRPDGRRFGAVCLDCEGRWCVQQGGQVAEAGCVEEGVSVIYFLQWRDWVV